MSLITVNSKEIVVGKPLPWTLYDRERNLLLDRGDIVRDGKHREALLAGGACHELSWETPGKEDGENSSPAAGETPPSQSGDDQTTGKCYTFDDMKLKVGDKLNLEVPSDYDFRLGQQPPNERFPVKVIGFLKGASLLVTGPSTSAVNAQLIAGKKVVMRSFSGQNAFGFSCSIERVCKVPYEYMHLSFPDIIEGIVIRKAPRVKTRIIAAVQSSRSGAAEQISALISDISANGASLDAKRPLGDKGDILILAFRVPLHNIDAYLSVKGAIRAVLGGDLADASKSDLIRHGLEFQELQPNDSVILQSMIYQQMIENPHKVV
ncbi:MAG: flagellar brake protein [Nitrosomonadales bacterium]|nr:flagellar brake protein [Nitrosomonadales bacterium]